MCIRDRSIIFCPSSDQKIPGRKLIASAKYQTGTIGNDVVRLISIMLLFVVFYAPFLMNAYAEKILLCSLLSSFSVIMLALMLLFMVDYAKKRQLCTRLCSFLLFVCLPFILYAFFCLYGSVSAPYSLFRSRSLVSQHSFLFCLTFHTLQRCSTSH